MSRILSVSVLTVALVVAAITDARILVRPQATVHSSPRVFVWDCSSSNAAAGWGQLLNETRYFTAAAGGLQHDVEVWLQGDCTTPLVLDPAQDSGNDNFTVTWKSDPASSRRARFNGGAQLAGNGFGISMNQDIPASARGKVFQQDLSGLDLGSTGFGNWHSGSLGQCAGDRTELFFNGAPMMTARYPNAPLTGGPWMNWLNLDQVNVVPPSQETTTTGNMISGEHLPPVCGDDLRSEAAVGAAPCRVVEKEAETTTNVFTFNATGMNMNVSVGQLGNVWIHGFWSFDWADSYVQLTNLNCTETDGTTMCQGTYNMSTPPVYGMKHTARFYILNSLAELDSPGEYFIDDVAKVLYFYPPNRDATVSKNGSTTLHDSNDIFLSASMEPLISISPGTGVALSHVHFENLDFAFGRDSGIALASPVASDRILLRNLNISNFGKGAVSLGNAKNSMIDNVTSRAIGCGAISVSGGDTVTLEPSNITVNNVDVAFYARLIRCYTPAVRFAGVGVVVQNSKVGYAPQQGMTGGGNNHRFLNNHFYQLCYGVSDAGAFYVGRSWIERGNLLDGNRFDQINTIEPIVLGSPTVNAMYLDDEFCGTTITNNRCNDVQSCLLLGGGRDNHFNNNRCVNAREGCVLMDDRGLNWQNAFCKSSLEPTLATVNYTFPPYSVEYPAIVNTLQDHPCTPVGNTIVGNSYCKTANFLNQEASQVSAWYSYSSGNTEDHDC